MTVTLVIDSSLASELERMLRLPVESGGVMFVTAVSGRNGDTRLLGRGMRWIADAQYHRREHNSLTIAPEAYVPFLAEAEEIGAACLWVHTHPGEGSDPTPSAHDVIVDDLLRPLFEVRTGSPLYGALVLAPNNGGIAFSGHLERDGTRFAIERIWQIGDRFRQYRHCSEAPLELSPAYDRSIRALGSAVQETLAGLRVAVVGCGGTGSAVAEQLLRLGVRRFLMFDPDVLSQSNVTRVYGSRYVDVGRPKVTILKSHLLSIASDAQVDAEQTMITTVGAAKLLAECDVVFGCTDDNAGRMILSRAATYLMLPVIDCGVLLSSNDRGELKGIDGRVTTLLPGAACLICRQRIDLRRAAAELLTPDERVRRENEGYAPALAGVEPAVVTFTTLVAASAVGELLERLTGFGPTPRPTEVLLRCHEREVSTNVALPRTGHYCDPNAGFIGRADVTPFLGQTWPTP
ncbi:MAG: ThiF family adenylyltransferase [Gemmatimonadaceae bacterium]|nr:ThiF family adenylyltransferase [Gemmatimonadaceae bacterium]